MTTARTRLRTAAETALGVFVVWQIIVVLPGNFLRMVLTNAPAARAGAVGQVLLTAMEPVERWCLLTGQFQGWAQFTPGAPHEAVFLAVDVRWDGERAEQLRSRIEPADFRRFYRPFLTGRLDVYELPLSLFWLPDWEELIDKRDPDRWRLSVGRAVRERWRPMQAYLHWRFEQYRRDHPHMPPPREYIFLLRVYDIPPPGTEPWAWPPPVEWPVARWRPQRDASSEYLPLELYDPATRRFEPLPLEE